jgi:hypothetical protein
MESVENEMKGKIKSGWRIYFRKGGKEERIKVFFSFPSPFSIVFCFVEHNCFLFSESSSSSEE